MPQGDDNARLLQDANLKGLLATHSPNDFVTVCASDRGDMYSRGLYCALIPNTAVSACLNSPSWELRHGGGRPGAVTSYEADSRQTNYYRLGDNDGIEPLVHSRDFYNARPGYRELSEEFRLFHNLYFDQRAGDFIKIDDDGNESIVARIRGEHVEIRLREILQYIAVREMHLSIQFDYREDSMYSLAELGLKEESRAGGNAGACWSLSFGEFGLGDKGAFSRLLGKRLIAPWPKERSGFPGFAEEPIKQYAEFEIGVKDDGTAIYSTCDPDALSNYFGANPGAPSQLTPVHFRKAVLDKYYQQPERFSVGDGEVRRAGLWVMTIDNHHSDRVCAWLGDLGQDLSYEEQLYWKSHNIAPSGTVSETFFRRQLLAQFTDSSRPEHQFHLAYGDLLEESQKKLGWQILIPLAEGDRHFLAALRVPSSDDQKQFDELVLALTKVLIDSLNERRLGQIISESQSAEVPRSIAKLEKVLAIRMAKGSEPHIGFLRKLQGLRSSGSAHRKGENYEKAAVAVGADAKPLSTVFESLLTNACDLLAYLKNTVQSGAFDAKAPISPPDDQSTTRVRSRKPRPAAG